MKIDEIKQYEFLNKHNFKWYEIEMLYNVITDRLNINQEEINSRGIDLVGVFRYERVESFKEDSHRFNHHFEIVFTKKYPEKLIGKFVFMVELFDANNMHIKNITLKSVMPKRPIDYNQLKDIKKDFKFLNKKLNKEK